MQKIEYRESPSPHVVVENFLPTAAARECLAEAQWLEPTYEEARVGGESQGYTDDCDECLAQRNTFRAVLRRNLVINLDEYFEDRRHKSVILSHLQMALVQPPLINAMNSFPGLFPIFSQTTHIETMLSSYGQCDFYGWHRDVHVHNTIPRADRIITLVLHFNTEPQNYSGGELILTGNTIEDQRAYLPVHNTAIFFESNKCVHAVNDTNHVGDFKDNRFSINLWAGFDSRNHMKQEEWTPREHAFASYKYR